MDIFKLFFDHDLPLDHPGERNTGNNPQTKMSIEDFMKPIPTYSKFYLSGTRLDKELFGLNILENFQPVLERLERVFSGQHFVTVHGAFDTLSEALGKSSIGDAILISNDRTDLADPSILAIDDNSNAGHLKDELKEALSENIKVLYKEKNHDGFDLHLFTKENMYGQFFYPLKELAGDSFRFFSINNKRIKTERQFYFEMWTLDKPPHGAEEVRRETIL